MGMTKGMKRELRSRGVGNGVLGFPILSRLAPGRPPSGERWIFSLDNATVQGHRTSSRFCDSLFLSELRVALINSCCGSRGRWTWRGEQADEL